MASKGQKFKKYSPKFKDKILKEYFDGNYGYETLYNNNTTSLEHYIQLVEEWIAFYNSTRLKNRNLN